VRLCTIASERWAEIDAAYYQPGRTILREKPHRFAGMVYAWAIERVPHDDLDEWLFDLRDLLPWQDSTSEAAADLESQSFLAMQAKGGG
jgi:hypothetical protein